MFVFTQLAYEERSGNYMKKRSHVNISSGIRKKLGIDKHETNIGIYVRKLLKKL